MTSGAVRSALSLVTATTARNPRVAGEVALTRFNPTVARVRLAARLHEARGQAGRSLDDLARFLDVSAPQASRLDSGARGFRPADVRRLARWYGFDEVDAKVLVALAEESRRREWWQQVDLPDAYRTYIGMEQEARAISEFHVSVIPGLLQTREYAMVAESVGEADADPQLDTERIERAVDVRMRRQEILERDDPPRLNVVIDEAALARGPRDVAIRRGQLEHLRAAADRANVTVQIIGFELGLYAGPASNLIILDMGPELSDLCYTEGLLSAFASSDADELLRKGRVWNELRAKALDKFGSKERIDRYLRQLPS
jgi:transcriptional regulator with XRE-family HTH domain